MSQFFNSHHCNTQHRFLQHNATERGIAMASRPSVRPSVCDVEVLQLGFWGLPGLCPKTPLGDEVATLLSPCWQCWFAVTTFYGTNIAGTSVSRVAALSVQ